MFKSIKIKNLRAITELEVDNLGQVNLFVGENNCGKTTTLEGLFFLIGATNPPLLINANSFRGLNVISKELWCTFFHDMEITVPIELSAEIRGIKEKQKLVIRSKKKKAHSMKHEGSDFVSVENVPGDSKPLIIPEGLEFEYSNSKDPDEKTISEIFMKGNEIVSEGVQDRAIRGVFINPLTIYSWKDRFGAVQRKKKLKEVLNFLKEIDPHVLDLRLNEIGLLEVDIGIPRFLPANLVGGGVVKFLSIALAMIEYEDGIVLIDEIDNGLHHSAQRSLWKGIFNWAQALHVQVFASTHSWECVKAFNESSMSSLFETEGKLFRIERHEDSFRVVEYTKEMLDESLESRWEVR